MKVDFDALRKQLDGPTGFRSELGDCFDHAQAMNGLGSCAGAFLRKATYCFLAGYWIPGIQLLDKAREWIDISIETGEKPKYYFPYGTEANRYGDRALIRWLRTGDPALDDLNLCVDNEIRYVQTFTTKDAPSARLSIIYYLEANRFQDARNLLDTYVERIESMKGRKGVLQAASWYVGRALANQPIDPTELNPFLRRYVAEWTNQGCAVDALRWIKRIYSTGCKDMPDAKTIFEKYREFC